MIDRTWLRHGSRYQQNLISRKTDEQLHVLKIAFIQYVFIDLNMDASQTTISFPKPCDIQLASFHLGLPRGSVSVRRPSWFPWAIYSWISPTDILAFFLSFWFLPSVTKQSYLSNSSVWWQLDLMWLNWELFREVR